MSRAVTRRYVDPLAQIWLGAARGIGMRVVRTPDAYASTDGRGTMSIATDEALDADDSLAQMIFHELCHSLVEGEDSFRAADWGMDNTGPDHDRREHACLRVQWVLTGRHGLRAVFAPTTDFRTTFWDTLSGDVLADRTDPSVQLAIAALRRSEKPPWAPHLLAALEASERVARQVAPFMAKANDDSLWNDLAPWQPPHPTGLPRGDAAATCGDCNWRYEVRGKSRCRQADTLVQLIVGRGADPNEGPQKPRVITIDPTWSACERFEASLDCQTCGACCRAAYHSVEVQKRDPAVKKQPDYIVDRGTYLEIKRNGDRCAALHGGVMADGKQSRFHCVIYDDRPRTCRDFTLGSDHCLTARRRVGMSL